MRLLHFFCVLCVLLVNIYGAWADCDATEFPCDVGDHCISIAWRCDGGDDCPDGSDEVGCPLTTCADNFFRCNTGKCIPNRWVCDKNADCDENEDETLEMCFNTTCDDYRCEKTGQCIPKGWQCDGANDCEFNDDERNCTTTCDDDEFQCASGECISSRWHCNHRRDCDDGSDEVQCPLNVTCSGIGEKKCNDGECLNDSWFCDGELDCQDESDELNCPDKDASEACAEHEFQCAMPSNKTVCVHYSWRCDGFPDCSDNSDEKDCGDMTCRSDERKCDNNYCLKDFFFCDKDVDCVDGSDEKNCNYTDEQVQFCEKGQFDCFGDGSICIPDNQICDGRDDCVNGADESQDQKCPPADDKVCSNKENGGCMQICVPSLLEKSKRRCECYKGYKIKEDNPTECEDIDECQLHGTCSQLCNNSKGSYKCSCMQGYELTNNRYCKAIGGKRPMLILSSRDELRSYHLDTFHYTLLLNKQVSAVAIDFNIRKDTVFWTDVDAGKVHSANLTTNMVNTIMDEDLEMPDGIAVDWIHENLYLADTGSDRIEVARLDGTNRKILISEDLDEPRSLVLDPHNGWMYWTDWGNIPKIEKCGMNGKNRKVIVQQQQIAWPNGLTIDYVGKRLYWVDAKMRNIGSTDLNGDNYKLILTDHRNLRHPFAITVFEDFLYWTDWMTNAVHRVNKFGSEHNKKTDVVTTIAPNLKSPMDIHVYHIYRQPITRNRCEHGYCSHLCLPVPQDETSTRPQSGYECACPNGMKLVTTTQCELDTSERELTTGKAKPIETTQKPGVPERTQRPEGTTKKVVVDVSSEVPYGMANQTTEESTGGATNSGVESKPPSEDDHGMIMGIVIGVLLLVGGSIAVVVFILMRNHRKKNVMSMNFDNPVYRKTTTDDQLVMEKNSSTPRDQSLQPLNAEAEVV